MVNAYIDVVMTEIKKARKTRGRFEVSGSLINKCAAEILQYWDAVEKISYEEIKSGGFIIGDSSFVIYEMVKTDYRIKKLALDDYFIGNLGSLFRYVNWCKPLMLPTSMDVCFSKREMDIFRSQRINPAIIFKYRRFMEYVHGILGMVFKGYKSAYIRLF